MIPTQGWIKSSHSNGDGGLCLEWAPARAASGSVPIRDSKRPSGLALLFPPPSWRNFVAALGTGRL
ncbi:DUF397 domain-containing protein [Streptomyces sp. AV19]|uniref:DUF397 domain-containing protein n=1 Tax=Streptomyces sp. AV19 TaxID=2793068 RepID=UPI0018FE766F|nr:DUF397 domain-containing protein [Streptomyces sp. AV19]MBH1933008.1 DUF397 domain-containing protein [Streptomyces sp. AV19]MDG4531720.1 DUF397 domain-containing protein [Streptomyces sp. AV19]